MRFLKRRFVPLLGIFAATGGLATAVALAGFVVKDVPTPRPAPAQAPNDLVVHEWGTFLAMSGSDGVTLDGMYHEEHALPAFVHARSRDQLRLPSVILKGETPVIYFYTGRQQKVRVDVRFPKGLWTQWYPQAQVVGPKFSQGAAPADPRDGRLVWCAEVIPAGNDAPQPPGTACDALWNHAREVDAAFVRTADPSKGGTATESERFLFYRGLGRAPLPVRFQADSGGTLSVGRGEAHGASHLFILRVENGRGAFAYRPAIRPGESLTDVVPSMDDAQPLDRFTDAVATALQRRLVESGLFEKEARAMVNTWRTSYFQTDGVRALFVLPQAWTDAFIPLTIEPRPRDMVRVMVGRVELLSPERERLAETAVRDLASPDAPTRERAFGVLRGQGRYVEPVVRRVLQTTRDERVRALCRRLLTTDFVTELRAAAHAATNGAPAHDDPVFIRARLAGVLREVGLEREAKAEGEPALAALRVRKAPAMTHPDARLYLRAVARAQEGVGDDRGALETYARFIRFGAQVRTNRNCRGCHLDAGPQDMAWYRDWWAGRRYAELATRTGAAAFATVTHKATLTIDPSDATARLILAYLSAARLDPAEAERHWAELTRPEKAGLASASQ